MPLTTDAYRYEHLTRRQLAGTPLIGQFYYRDLYIFGVRSYIMAEDRFMSFLHSQGRLSGGQLAAYTQALREAFPDINASADWTNEAIYAQCEAVRTAFLREHMTPAQQREAWALSWSGAFARTLAMPAPQARFDQRALEDKLLCSAEHVILYLADGEFMLEALARVKACAAASKQVTVIAPRTACGHIPDTLFWAEALGGDRTGVMFHELDAASSTLDPAALDLPTQGALLLGFGEDALLTLHSLSIPAFVTAIARCFYTQMLAGTLTAPCACHCYVPAGFSMYPYAPPTEKIRLSYRHLAQLWQCHGECVYELSLPELYRLAPPRFAAPFEDDMDWAAEGPQIQWQGDDFAAFDSAAHASMVRMIGALPGVHALSGYFNEITLETAPIPFARMRSILEGASMEPLDARAFPGLPIDTPITASTAEGIFVTGALLESVQDAQVLMAGGAALSPRAEYHAFRREHPDATWLMSNFLFFMTPRLIGLYNRLREDRPRETLKRHRGHIDYQMRETPEGRFETFPLFRKACLGMRRDGRFTLFHFSLGGGAVEGEGFRVTWLREDVNPERPGSGIAIYTPDGTRGDHPENHLIYRRVVGEGCLNLVLVDDEIICARLGDVVLPSIGVVISISADAAGEWIGKMAGTLGEQDEQGYFDVLNQRVRVRLDPPDGFTPDSWAQLRWAYGGGLTLIEEGKAVFAENTDALADLEAEGWMTPLSRQTQESNIHVMARHPRTVVGQTMDGKLFVLVFSGRTNFSAGADYRELCVIAQRLIPDIACMMNVDGGGSSFFGIAANGGFAEVSYPAPSDTTSAGLSRPVNTMLVLRVGGK